MVLIAALAGVASATRGDDRQAFLSFHSGVMAQGGTTWFVSGPGFGHDTETENQLYLPTTGEASNLSVTCDQAMADPRTMRFTLRINGADTPLACTVESGSTTCSDEHDTAGWNPADLLTMKGTLSGCCEQPTCNATVAVTAPGAGGPHNAILAWGGGASSPRALANGDYCEPFRASDDCANKDTGGGFPFPNTANLAALGYRVTRAEADKSSQTFIIQNQTTALSTDLSVETYGSGGSHPETRMGSDTRCTTNCTVSLGDRVVVGATITGNSFNQERLIVVEADTVGQPVGGRAPAWTAGTRYLNTHTAWMAAESATVYRTRRAALGRNLFVDMTQAAGSDFTVTFCSGPSNPPSCTGIRPTCMVSSGATTCADTIDAVNLAADDYYTFQAAAPNLASGSIGVSVEIAAPPTSTPTPSPTSTATTSQTPTQPPTTSLCVGDCTDDAQVTVDEILIMVNMALGSTPLSRCPAADANHDGQITVDEILIAVNNALSGCRGGGLRPASFPWTAPVGRYAVPSQKRYSLATNSHSQEPLA